MGRHRTLIENDAGLGIDPGGDIGRGHLAGLVAQFMRVLRLGERVQIDDAKDAFVILLQGHPIANGAEIIAEM